MERLLAVFSISDVLVFILSGGLVVAAYVWVIHGIPADLTLQELIAVTALFYVAGRFVQSVGSLVDRYVLWPFVGRPTEAEPPTSLKPVVERAMNATFPKEIAELGLHERIQFLRSYLRLARFSDRAELLNELHFIFRGFAAAGLLTVPVFLGGAIYCRHVFANVVAASLAIACTIISYSRYRHFGQRFAHQLWVDFVVLTETKAPTPRV